MSKNSHIKGRGAQHKMQNRFFELQDEDRDDFKEYRFRESEDTTIKTRYIDTFPKTIVNKVTSPDVGMEYSLNPYQGCEHGCVYCYARNSHEFWGYGAGIDFESTILIKRNAPELLERKMRSRAWKAAPIVLSGNTDCYQPIEKKLEITRALLKICLKYKHPVAVITKNALVQRDLDIITALAQDNLFRILISITSLSEETRRMLEPRTASIKKRLETVALLSKVGIPVGVMVAPIIPGINSHEILPIIKEVAARGALTVSNTIVRLNGAIGKIFEDWIRSAFPDKADKVLNQIAACHGGTVNDSRYGIRMRGEGELAKQINAQVALGRRLYLKHRSFPALNCNLHESCKDGQMKLF